jgi:hypothetical protein
VERRVDHSALPPPQSITSSGVMVALMSTTFTQVCLTSRCGFHLIIDFERHRHIGANHAFLRVVFVVYETLVARRRWLVSDITRQWFSELDRTHFRCAEFSCGGKVRSLETSLWSSK